MKKLIKILFVCLPLFSFGGEIENSKISNDPVKKSVENDTLSSIKSMVEESLKRKFGHSFTIDPGMEKGCYNYLDSYLTKNAMNFVDGQAHYHDLFIMDRDPLDSSPEYFAKEIIESVESPDLAEVFDIFVPTRYWVTTKKIGEKYYLIIALD